MSVSHIPIWHGDTHIAQDSQNCACPHGTSAKSQHVAPRGALRSSRQRLMQLLPLPILTPVKLSLLARAPGCLRWTRTVSLSVRALSLWHCLSVCHYSSVAPEHIWKWGGDVPVRRESGGHRFSAKRPKENFWSCPPLFFGCKRTISRFRERFRDGQYRLVSFLFAVLLLTVPPCPAICKSGGTCPRAPQSRRHCTNSLAYSL